MHRSHRRGGLGTAVVVNQHEHDDQEGRASDGDADNSASAQHSVVAVALGLGLHAVGGRLEELVGRAVGHGVVAQVIGEVAAGHRLGELVLQLLRGVDRVRSHRVGQTGGGALQRAKRGGRVRGRVARAGVGYDQVGNLVDGDAGHGRGDGLLEGGAAHLGVRVKDGLGEPVDDLCDEEEVGWLRDDEELKYIPPVEQTNSTAAEAQSTVGSGKKSRLTCLILNRTCALVDDVGYAVLAVVGLRVSVGRAEGVALGAVGRLVGSAVGSAVGGGTT